MYNLEWQTIKGVITLFLIVGIGFLFYFSKKDEKDGEIKADFIVNGMIYNRICIDNKEFVQGGTRLSINLDFEGKPIKCGEN